MKKVITHGIIALTLFLSTWVLLNQINWMELLEIEKATSKTEIKLGELYWDIFKNSEVENKEVLVNKTIDSLVVKICSKNNIDREHIKVHILNKDEVNAFALPDGHLIIYSGLILASENPEELSGVIGHELAHIELNHVMRKLVNEIGLSVLISMTTGNGGKEVLSQTAKLLSSKAFDRDLEKEADLKAVDYLIKSKIDPEPFANFLYKLTTNENELQEALSWVSSHPELKERATYILEYADTKKTTQPEMILAQKSWKKLQEHLD